MIKSRELADPNSCLNRAGMKEPLFVLRANDRLSADAVRTWAKRYRLSKGFPDTPMTARQRAKYDEALKLAEQMDDWQFAMRATAGKEV